MKLIKKLESRLNPNSKRKYKMPWGLFECPACGRQIEKDYHNGVRQKTCGCISWRDAGAKANIKHGGCQNGKNSRLYEVWHGIKRRCYEKTNDSYQWYGKRGIFVCDQWLNDFSSFKKWALSNGYKDNLQLDRVNNDGPYSPDNCQFLTSIENARKQTSVKLSMEKAETIRFLYAGGIGTQDNLGKYYGVHPVTIHQVIAGKTWVEKEVI